MWQSIVGAVSLLVLSLGLAATASATPIAWGTPVNVSAASDVSQSGTFVDGIEGWSGNSTLTIGDATFHQPSVNGNIFSTPSGDIALTFGASFQYGDPTGPSSSPQYNALVNENGNGDGTATLSGLTAGLTYQVEVWAVTRGYTDTTTLDGTTPLDAGTGQFVLGTFTASSGTETFTYAAPNGDSRISAVQLRQLTTVAEPSSVMLASLGAAGLLAVCYRVRRRDLSAAVKTSPPKSSPAAS